MSFDNTNILLIQILKTLLSYLIHHVVWWLLLVTLPPTFSTEHTGQLMLGLPDYSLDSQIGLQIPQIATLFHVGLLLTGMKLEYGDT